MYQQSIDTDVEKGFVKTLGKSEVKSTFGKEWYLPHHPVLNPNKPGNVRRVCNAAAKYKDVGLNDKLLAGLELLHGLIGTIFRFREGPIALTADIESMFLQVQVPERDKSCLRFLWRPTMNERVQIYEYQRHVFGAKSSPTCANYALKQVAIDKEDEFPIAAKTIQNNFYMDDFIKSVETPEESIKVFKQLQPSLSKHGFELKKWITNSEVVTNAIPEDLRSISNTKQVEVEPGKEGSSVLGLQWTITDDSLQVCRGTSKEVETPITQRKLLSLVSSVFDPLGLFAPFSVHMRRLLKSNWSKNGQHWDNSVEPNEEEEYLKWKAQLPEVAETSIDRRYFSTAKDKWELHVFADASEDTMCAVAYLRSKPKEYSADLAFVIGKCRAAPMRHLSIPRLELQAAVMAVRLKEQIVKEHEAKIQSCNFWSDSTTVLQWIHSSHRKQQVFVANRVTEILDTTNVSQWNHVSGINNPADIGTRAISVDELKRSEWLTGPAWLKQRENEWPEQLNLTFASDEQNDEMVFSAKVKEKKPMIQWERFSNYNRLVNTMAYIQRVFKKHKPATKTLSVEEREDAQASIFRLLQQEQFTEEMKSLKAEKELAEYIAAWNRVRIEEHLIQQGIRWKFNPPAAPHFGGVWERLVRSCKKAMYAVLGNRSVTEDVLSTTMCLVEQTLNARPLTQVSSDATDLEAITPNHFLLGNKNLCLPYLSGSEQFVDHRKLFRQTQAYADLIWDRFRKEYLPTLNSRKKWQTTTERSLQRGDLVWLVEDSDKRGYYNLGRITETFEGSDGVIRSAKIRTKDGYYKRPVVKLAPVLPTEGDVFTKENRAGDVGAELKE